QGLQIIPPEEGGKKRFLSGMRAAGGFFTIGTKMSEGPVVIGEGVATCASIHEATGLPVLAALSSGNLIAVAKEVRRTCPDAPIILAADDERRGEDSPGLVAAKRAAEAV